MNAESVRPKHRGPLSVALTHRICALCLFIVFSPLFTNADSWDTPKPYEVFSHNSNYVAKVAPGAFPSGNNLHGPSLSVFRVEAAGRVPCWSVKLRNRVCPVEVLLTDDGEYAVTLDSWHSVGYGEDVIAFYNRRGLVRSYSLEAALAGGSEQKKRSDFYDAFSHSVSSRWWRNNSIIQFDGTTTNAVFGIWLDWAGGWFAWRLTEGLPVKLQGNDLMRWNDLGRAQACSWLESPEVPNRPSPEQMRKWTAAAMAWSGQVARRLHNQVVACRYLAYTKRPADRKYLEKALRSSELNVNWEPELRIAADGALAILDGASDSFKPHSRGEKEHYHRLGTIDLAIELPQMPAKGEGQLYVSLYSETVRADEWRQAPALFRTGTSFKSSSTKASSEVKISIPAFWPGRYWIEIVWERNPPFQHDLYLYEGMREWKESREPAPIAGADDFESGMPEMFEVKSGQTAVIKIKCIQPGH